LTHGTDLLMTLAVGLGAAFVGGMLANRLRLPPLVGYLLAGMAIGPFTPGLVANTGIVTELAEVGVILLMFGVGLHFSIQDLWAVRNIAVPGAIAQIGLASLMGLALSSWWGWSLGAGIVFGLALSVASTVVLLRALTERGIVDSVDGRIAVGWLIVEDLAMVLVLVLLPAFAGHLGASAPEPAQAAGALSGVWGALALTLGKVALFVAIMLVAGTRLFPWMLTRVANTGSRELFTLSVLATSLGVAYLAAQLFDVSFALGAFFAGVVVSGSHLSHQVAEDALPLQDAFAVLFFVSVGMLFDPRAVLAAPGQLVATVAVIMGGKSLAALAIVWLFRYPTRTALMVSASLAQIGEFSFILASLGLALGLLPAEEQNLILAGAIISISLNPLLFSASDRLLAWLNRHPALLDRLDRRARFTAPPLRIAMMPLQGHAIVIGHGRVGARVSQALETAGVPVIVIEQNRQAVEDLRQQGIQAIYGDAAHLDVLEHAAIDTARLVVVAIPNPTDARAIVAHARRENPAACIVARTHLEGEQAYLEGHGADQAVYAETELAKTMLRHAFNALEHFPPDEGSTLLVPPLTKPQQ
jgi:CPA2 family monovalent cation:H+ antiporter-2